jgi:hypothetical protein
MKNHANLLAAFVLLVVLTGITGVAQVKRTTIDIVVANPSDFEGEAIDIDGLVIQYVPATSATTSYYLLRGDYGAELKVNTAEPAPETNAKYHVTGILYVDLIGGQPFLSEKTRAPIVSLPPPPPPRRWHLYAAAGAVILLSGTLFFVFTKKGRPAVAQERGNGVTSAGQQGAKAPPQPPRQAQPAAEPPPTYSTASQFKTVKIVTSPPKTLKFIPGQLVIVSGDDRGKYFRIAGYPTVEGSIATVGRDVVNGDRAYAHIQIDNRFSTVSRRQAELLYRENRLYVRNLSETNCTQIDGIEIKPGQLAELNPGSTMRCGELEFQYKA